MTARQPTPPASALDRLPGMFEAAVAELSDCEAALIRNVLSRAELADFDAARKVATKLSECEGTQKPRVPVRASRAD